MISQKHFGPARKIATAAAAALVLSACGGDGPTPTPTTPTPTTPTPTTPTPTTPTPTTPTPTTPTPTGERLEHQDNVFAWAEQNNVPMYVNPWWNENAENEPGGAAMADYSTGVWMDRIGAVESYTGLDPLPDQGPNLTQDGEEAGLAWHLDNALAQGNAEHGALFHFVVYDLPGRDCSAAASNGELEPGETGMRLYREEFIGRIKRILSEEKYASIPVAAVIEIDSLPNLVTNPDDCVDVDNTKEWGYTNNIRYAVNELSELSNVHLYIDAGHSGWLGWDDDLNVASMFMAGVIGGFDEPGIDIDSLVTQIQNTDGNTGKYDDIASAFQEPPNAVTPPGWNKISGFITNTANYTPLGEPNLPDPQESIGGEPIRSAEFYDWNPRFGELEYTADWLDAIADAGADTSGWGMLIDTGRNGWGGPPSPSTGSTPTDHVEVNKLDRRPHRGAWCNQKGGVGERPGQPASDLSSRYDGPTGHLDAFVWTKPQGESDGISYDGPQDPNDVNKQHDQMCDPDGVNRYAEDAGASNLSTGAIEAEAPHAGRWFSEAFQLYMENAYPPL